MVQSSPGSDNEDYVTPRWVKVFGTIALVLILIFAIIHLTGHGLGGHSLHGMGLKP